MNKTLYLRDEDGPIWDRARELSGDKLSPVIVDALRRYVADKESEAKGFERIEIRFRDAADNDTPKAKAFYGRWVYAPEEPYRLAEDHDGERWTCFAIAITVRNNVVFYWWKEEDDASWFFRFAHFPSLSAAAESNVLKLAAMAAIERVGVPVEELDI